MSRVFGYGSLVNTRTHGYPDCRPARLSGYRRVWRHSTLRSVAFLSVEQDPDGRIDGLLASVPAADWAALDHRERAYERRDVAHLTDHDGPPGPVVVYEVAAGHLAPPDTAHPILLSYIDVVMEGYLDHFGRPGLDRFVASTAGWQAPVLDDRAAPVYTRHTAPGAALTEVVDSILAGLGTRIEPGTPERLDPLRSNPNI